MGKNSKILVEISASTYNWFFNQIFERIINSFQRMNNPVYPRRVNFIPLRKLDNEILLSWNDLFLHETNSLIRTFLYNSRSNDESLILEKFVCLTRKTKTTTIQKMHKIWMLWQITNLSIRVTEQSPLTQITNII